MLERYGDVHLLDTCFEARRLLWRGLVAMVRGGVLAELEPELVLQRDAVGI